MSRADTAATQVSPDHVALDFCEGTLRLPSGFTLIATGAPTVACTVLPLELSNAVYGCVRSHPEQTHSREGRA